MPARRAPLLVTAAVLALVATVAPSWLARGHAVGAALTGLRPTALRFDALASDFDAYTGETVRHDFLVGNPTGRPIRITGADTTCGCVAATAHPRYLEPGASGRIEVVATLDGRYGPQHFRVRVRTDEGERTGCLLTLRGEARTLVRPDPWRWLAGPIEPGREAHARIALRWTGPIASWEVEARGEDLSVARADDALDLTIAAPWSVGNHFDGVLLRIHAKDDARVVETWIPVVWCVEPALTVEPATLELRGGSGSVTVRERWPGMVPLASVDAGALPVSVEWKRSESGRADVRVVLTGSELDVPLGAVLKLVPEPAAMGVVEVPVVVRRAPR